MTTKANNRMIDGALVNVLDWGVSNTGTLSDTELQTCVTQNQGKVIWFPPGTYNFSVVPTGINGVQVKVSSKQRLNWVDVEIPSSSEIIVDGKELAIVSCVIRYYDDPLIGPAGWYTLFDGDEKHDPVMMGGVTASGSASLIISVNFSQFGLDAAQWTPSGFVVGPDEALADSGVVFGASVGSTQVVISGTYNCPSTAYVAYNGTDWTFSGFGYDNPTYSNGVLTMDRQVNLLKGAANFMGGIMPVMRRQTAADWGANQVHVGAFAPSATQVSLIFTDNNGDRILTPDTRLKFWLTDTLIRNPDFNFSVDPGGNANIWMVGVFVKAEGEE